MQWDRRPVHKLSATFHPVPMEPGGGVPVPKVELHDPLVDLANLLQPVGVSRGGRSSVSEPGEFRRVQYGGHDQLVLRGRVELVLLVHDILEPQDAISDGGEGATSEEVVHTGHKQDSHRSLVPAVVNLVGVLQCGDCRTRYGDPINMGAVRGAGHAWFARQVELVQLTVPKTDVQPSLWPDMVAQLTCGTHVEPVAGGVLHALQDPNLPGGGVAVVDRDAWRRLCLAVSEELVLPVAADIALWRHSGSSVGAG